MLHLVGDEMSMVAAEGQRSCGESIRMGGNPGSPGSSRGSELGHSLEQLLLRSGEGEPRALRVRSRARVCNWGEKEKAFWRPGFFSVGSERVTRTFRGLWLLRGAG